MATFEELTGLKPIAADPVARPLNTIHGTGSDTRRREGDEQARLAEETSTGDTFKAAWQRNIVPMFIDDVQRKWEHQPDPTFDPTTWVNENKDSLPGVNLEKFQTVRSVGEAEELRDDMVRATENDKLIQAKGVTGVAATLLTGLVDPAELAIGFATAGYGKAATVAGRFAKVTGSGLRGGVASGVAAHQVDPNADAKNIVMAGLSGALISGGIGLVANGATGKARREYAGALDDLPPADQVRTEAPTYSMTGVGDFTPDFVDSPQSLGAASTTPGDSVTATMSPTSGAIYTQSMATIRDNNLGTRLEDTDFDVSTPEGRTAKRFSDFMATSPWAAPLRTDFDRMANGGSRVELAMAYNLLESPEGRIRNNRSAAMLSETYEQRLSSHSLPVLDHNFGVWAGKRNVGILKRNGPDARSAYDRAIIEELEARFHEGKPVSSDPEIKAAADAIDANYKDALDVAKGRDGEQSVDGFDEIDSKSGFFNHRWNGAAIRKQLARGVPMERIERLLESGYARTNPDMDPEYRTMVSKAVVRRAMAREDGIDTNMINTLDSDASDFLREMLVDSGYDLQVIDRLIDSIKGRREEQGKLGTAKRRVQVDLRTSDGDLSLMDLVDTNLTRVMSRYNREISGNAALARKGITNRAQRKQVIEAALQERRARGLPSDEGQRRFLEDIFTYFDSGPIGGGAGEVVPRAKRLTNLALLNQMGLTQLGETGAQIASVGMDTWRKHASSVFKEMRKQGPEGPLVSELRPIMGRIGEDHLLFRDDLMMDEMKTAVSANKFLGTLDFALGKGQRIQGYASGFFHVRSFQQKVAVASMADKVMQRLRDGVDEAELADIGVPPSLKRYIDDGTVEFDADGFTDKLNLDRWEPADAEDFALALNRHTHQVVQKAMAGEETMWMHKTVGSLYMHLKSFPMMAMRKQSVRTSVTSRPLALATLTMGLATAGLAYEAKQIINGRPENVNPEAFARGAFGMSNMTGWVPMIMDPAAAMLGMDDLRFNQYGRHAIDSGIIALPPSVPTINKMLRAPGVANPLSDLSDNEKIRIMQSMPLVGNAYGMTALFNAMKD